MITLVVAPVPQNPRRPRTRWSALLSRKPSGVPEQPSLGWSILLLLMVASELVLADAPLRPPAKYTVCSPNQAFCAVADPTTDSVSVFARDAKVPSWSLKPWHRQVFLANDGDHLIIGPSGLELIPLDTKLADPLLTFMNRKAIVRVVSVGDLFASLSSLRRTASHYYWGRVVGVSARDQLWARGIAGEEHRGLSDGATRGRRLLRDLVAIPSVNPMGRALQGPDLYEHRVTSYLEDFFRSLGVPWKRQHGRNRKRRGNRGNGCSR